VRPLIIDTLFLDAGGVLCHPSWTRVSDALREQGITIGAEALANAEVFAKKEIDSQTVTSTTTDAARGWLYFDKLLEHAGITASPATDAALDTLREYHRAENLWECVPDDVPLRPRAAHAVFRRRARFIGVGRRKT
jgi:hypothetical protein